MADARVENLARILVRYSTKIQPGERVAIRGTHLAAPLLRKVYREVLMAGGFPYLLADIGGTASIFFEQANEEQLQHVSCIEEMVRGEFEASIFVASAANTRELSGVDPARQSIRAKAHAGLMATTMQRSAAGDYKWCSTLYPTDAYAQDAEMSLADFEDYVYGTTYADSDEPVAEWRAIHDMQQHLVDWLEGKKRVEVKGPNIDMSLSIEGRTFINSDGTHNMPSGEIFTGPVEDSVNGWVRFTYPAVTHGREVDGIELVFEGGKVVTAKAEKNEDFLLSQLDTDPGARYLGEWAIGTNKKIDRFIKNILFDEKIGGTIHMAVGAGYPETGSENKSAIHWDMICDMRDGGVITVDGVRFYDSGEFLV
ncbi:MAG: aminopeptidase [Anaerolineae bacterium]